MGTLDDFVATFGAKALEPTPYWRRRPQVWYGLCVCGHLDKYHAPSIGGTFKLVDTPSHPMADGRTFEHRQFFDGCRGALVGRGQQTTREERNTTGDTVSRLEFFLPTCPCTAFRKVVEVDGPNRYFNQKVPVDRSVPSKHPFAVGVRALSTFLSKRRNALSDPSWAAAEFDRRFIWTQRACEISGCTAEGDGVWPVFIDGELSELRCEKHR